MGDASNIPTSFVAGDTVRWSVSFSNYPSSIWSLKYRLVNQSGALTVTATPNSNAYSLTITADQSATLSAGVYQCLAWVEKGAGGSYERYSVFNGSVTITANYATSNASDTRSWARKALDAVEAVIAGRATKEYESMTIGGRTITMMSPAELMTWRSRLKYEVRMEEQAERLANGLEAKKILTRFSKTI